tara:strand:- start:120 stop:527 length:408 start_codon:yes stop_codon:yes gene_type:complete
MNEEERKWVAVYHSLRIGDSLVPKKELFERMKDSFYAHKSVGVGTLYRRYRLVVHMFDETVLDGVIMLGLSGDNSISQPEPTIEIIQSNFTGAIGDIKLATALKLKGFFGEKTAYCISEKDAKVIVKYLSLVWGE